MIQHFDATVRMTPYAEFVAAIARRFELAGFLMTPDAAFGHERRGTPAALAELGRSMGFSVDVVAPFEVDGRAVSSTEIRAEIAAGDLQAARRLLGRSVAVAGRLDADRLAFELPVAVPPAGRYRVEVEPAWAPGRPRSGRRSPAIGVVEPRRCARPRGGPCCCAGGGSSADQVHRSHLRRTFCARFFRDTSRSGGTKGITSFRPGPGSSAERSVHEPGHRGPQERLHSPGSSHCATRTGNPEEPAPACRSGRETWRISAPVVLRRDSRRFSAETSLGPRQLIPGHARASGFQP